MQSLLDHKTHNHVFPNPLQQDLKFYSLQITWGKKIKCDEGDLGHQCHMYVHKLSLSD